jgi:hypothetical protein
MLDSRRQVRQFVRQRAAGFCIAFITLVLVVTGAQINPSAQSSAWPRNDAKWTLDLVKLAGPNMTEPSWIDLVTPGASATVGLRITSMETLAQPVAGFTDIQVRYMVHGVPISDWLPTPFTFNILISNPAFDSLPDGLHDISVDVMGSSKMDYKPRPMFLHLLRGKAVSPIVPLMSRDCIYCDYGSDFGPGVFYVDPTGHRPHGHPVDPNVTAFHDLPYQSDLYQEEMAPHSNHFDAEQMWWEHPASQGGGVYARAFSSKTSEDHRDLRTTDRHDSMPYKDGPRGVAWTSPYVSGQIDATGGFAFAEIGGPIRYMRPDGEVLTVAGWRVKPGREPIWYGKPVDIVRQNEELRGTWTEGQYAGADAGMHTPLDVAIDPTNDHIWYVPGYEDNVIWKLVIAPDYSGSTVSVFAGDPGHAAGFVDGNGHTARFHGPASLVFDPICDCMYVADQDNDSIRRISRTGAVTTLFGTPGMGARLVAAGVTTTDQYAIQRENQQHSQYEVSALQATTGVKPDVYLPQVVRVDSKGNLITLDIGFGGIRRINPLTGETHHLINAFQRFENNFGTSGRGWAWLDVDRFGNSGPLDGIYYCVFQMSWIEGEDAIHTNEAYGWVPSTGGPGHFLFEDWEPYPDGWGRRGETDPPHYGWLVAVDPRGGVMLAGGGEHGITRLRARRATDVVPQDYFDYERGKQLWSTASWRGGSGLTYAPSLSIKFGNEAHNFLGFADAWDYKDASDAELITAFELPSEITSDAPKLKTVLNFIRLNGGKQVDGYTPLAPTPVAPAPTPTPTPTPTTDTSGSSGSGSDSGTTTPTIPSGSTCTTPDPFISMGGGTCVDGGWLPPTTGGSTGGSSSSGSSSSGGSGSSGCLTQDPFMFLGGGHCVGGGWLPPSLGSGSSGSSSSSGSSGSSGSGSGSGGCITPDPFVSLGGGRCVGGGWLPPVAVGGSSSGGGSSSSGASSSSGGGSSSGCRGADPFKSLGGGSCVGGGWIPPGMSGQPSGSSSSGGTGSSSGSTSSSTSSSNPTNVGGSKPGGCTTPDPFRTIPGLVGLCVSGGWIPMRVGG